MPHAPRNPLDVLSVDQNARPSAGAAMTKVDIAAGGTYNTGAVAQPGFYAFSFNETANPTQTAHAIIVVGRGVDGVANVEAVLAESVVATITAMSIDGTPATRSLDVSVDAVSGFLEITLGATVLAGTAYLGKLAAFPS